jgi:hypothetical protein
MRRLCIVLAVAFATCGAYPKDVQQHPLYPMLEALDRQIAALRATVDVPVLTFAGARAADAAEADRDLAAAAERQRTIGADTARDRTTEARALANLARGGDAGGLNAYRNALAGTKNATLSAYAQALSARVSQAYDLRAAQFAQAESTFTYGLERRDAGATLPLRMKLDLHPDTEKRATLQNALNAILARESAATAALQSKDRAALAAYRTSLETAARRDYAAGSADASSRTAANLRARANLNLSSTGRLWDEWKTLSQSNAAAVDASAEAFDRQRTRSATRARQLSGIESASTQATLQQIAALQRQRQALYDEIARELCRSRDSGCPA